MAMIVDPDQLNQGVEVTITPATKIVKLNLAGNLSSDGVTLKAVYSFLKEEWKNDANLIKYPFPMGPITDEQFELINGWDFDKTGTGNDHTPNLIRTGGWALKNDSGVSLEEWSGIVTLGSLGGADQVYYQQASGAAATDVVRTGAVNQAVKVYGDATHGNFDYRSFFKLFVREYQKIYASAQLNDIGVSAMTYQVYRFPLANAADLKIGENPDGTVDAYGVAITWYGAAQAKDIGGTNRNFHVVINGNGKTAEEIYRAVQSALRKSTDIDAGGGTKTGETADSLLRFVGDTLYTIYQTEGGVFIENFSANDINRVVFYDDTNTERTFPFTASLQLNFGDNLKNDGNAIFRVYFTNDDAGDNTGRDFGTANAITVNDASASPMAGSIGGAASITKTFSYDSNVQRGAASIGTDAPITVVAIGLGTGQYVKATGTIGKNNSNSVTLTAALERNYGNP
jgi:hypothetical protein